MPVVAARHPGRGIRRRPSMWQAAVSMEPAAAFGFLTSMQLFTEDIVTYRHSILTPS